VVLSFVHPSMRARIVLDPNSLHESSEAFVQPSMRPIAAGQKISEPLVRKLVRDKSIAREIQMRSLVVKSEIGLSRSGSVFHPAENEILNCDLTVFLVGIHDPRLFPENLDHLRSIAERKLPFFLASRLDKILDRNP